MLSLIFYLIVFNRILCCKTLSFVFSFASNGSPLCAVGNPSFTIQTDDIIGVPFVVPGAAKCGFFCTGLNSRITCTGYNYLTSGLCQFFSDPCLSTSLTQGCMYYKVCMSWCNCGSFKGSKQVKRPRKTLLCC